MEITRHLTATTFVVYKNKTLLHLHKKLGLWLPPGGHIDRDELPEEAALREVKEETGLDVKLYNPDQKMGFTYSKQILRPMHVLLENINKFHQHIDSIFFATANTFNVKSGEGETDDLKWVTIDELDTVDVKDDVRELSIQALKLLGK